MKHLLFILLVTGLNCQAQEIENVLDLEFYLPVEVETWYNENYKKNVKSDIWILGDIFSEPNTSSKKVGQLITYYEPSVNNYILQFRNVSGKVEKEINNIGDWGYGIHINVIGSSNGFAQLPNAFMKTASWIRLGEASNSLNGSVTSYLGQIVYLSTTSVSKYPNGTKHTLEKGNYVIEKHLGNKFIIREEVSADMPCGEDVEEINLNTLPRYELPIRNLVDKNGEIWIEVAYPRGC